MKIKKHHLGFVFSIVFMLSANAQVDYAMEGIQISISDKTGGNTMEEVQYADADFFYTAPEYFTSLYTIGKFEKLNMSAVWQHDVPSKLTVGKKKVEPYLSFHMGDGVTHILCTYHNSKKKHTELFYLNVDEDGVQSKPKMVGSFPTHKKGDFKLKLLDTDDEVVLLALNNVANNREQSIFGLWISKDWENFTIVESEVYDEADQLESMAYDKVNRRVYATTHTEYLQTPAPKYRFLFSMDANTEKSQQIEIESDEYRFFSCYINVNPFNQKVHLLGFIGGRKSKQMSTVYNFNIHPEGLLYTAQKGYPITEEAIEDLAASKTGYDKMWEASNSVNFNLEEVYFVDQNAFYIVFDNGGTGMHSGQLVVYVDEKNEKSFMRYLGRYGWGSSVSKVDGEGNLLCYAVDKSKYIEKRYQLKGVEDSNNKNHCLTEFKVTPNKDLKVQVIGNLGCDNYFAYLRSWEGVGDHDTFHFYVCGGAKNTIIQFLGNQ